MYSNYIPGVICAIYYNLQVTTKKYIVAQGTYIIIISLVAFSVLIIGGYLMVCIYSRWTESGTHCRYYSFWNAVSKGVDLNDKWKYTQLWLGGGVNGHLEWTSSYGHLEWTPSYGHLEWTPMYGHLVMDT